MAEINVNVSAGKQQKITVSSAQNSTEITASADTGRFWAQTSKNWAVSENIVDNEDYSSKYYANKSKGYAQNAENFEGAARETYNNFIVKSENAITDIETAKADAVGNITTARDESIASVEAKSDEILSAVNQGIADINSTKTTILGDIEFVADGEKEEIEELVDTGKNEIQELVYTGKDEIQELTNEIKNNAEDIINRVSLSMFDTILKDHLLTYEESKGLALQGTYVYKDAIAGSRYGYPDFYAKCLEEYNEATTTETVNGVTVKVHSNGHKFYDIANKSAIDGFFNTMGSAWFYGVDTAEERIFLPRNNFFEQMTANVAEVGDSIQAGLPNITGGYSNSSRAELYGADINLYGAFAKGASSSKAASTSSGGPGYGFTFDASRSSSIYGNSNTVQPNAVKKLLYICVGNTVADTSWVDVVTQVESGVKDLEDKTLEGIERLKQSSNALTQSQITNCLLEIPQRIKLELKNGTLTLKAGSEVIVPNGFEADGTTPKFDYITVESDSDWSSSSTAGTRFGYYGIGLNQLLNSVTGYTYSGNTATMNGITPQAYTFFYNTETNRMYRGLGGAWGESNISLPVCLFTNDSTATVTSIDQVFNGFGDIGSTIWVDKGVKVLIPNGRNEDGSLNNIEYTVSSILTFSYNYTGTVKLMLKENSIRYAGAKSYSYNADENIAYDAGNKIYECNIGEAEVSSGVITSFQPKLPFRAVDYNDKQEIISWCMPDYSAGISIQSANSASKAFTAPCDGIIDCEYVTTSVAGLPVIDTVSYGVYNGSAIASWVCLPINKGQKFYCTSIHTQHGAGSNKFYPLKGAN